MSDSDDLSLLVTGATGKQGGAVARHALRRGFRVRALTRDPGQPAAERLAERGAEVVRGDFDDRASLRRAMDGVHGVFSVQDYWEGTRTETERGIRVAEVAAESGVGHLVYTSAASCDRDTDIPHFESKRRIEERVRELDVPHTILRPVAFMENWEWPEVRDSILSGTLAWPLSAETSYQQIAVSDIGAVAVMAFEDPASWLGRTRELAGDERTMAEIADAFGRALDRKVRYVEVPWEEIAEGEGEDTSMTRFFREQGFQVDIGEVRRFHPGLLSFEDYLEAGPWGSG